MESENSLRSGHRDLASITTMNFTETSLFYTLLLPILVAAELATPEGTGGIVREVSGAAAQ